MDVGFNKGQSLMFCVQLVCAEYAPGVVVPGLSSMGYFCNGYVSFWATIGAALALQTFDIIDLRIM